MRIFLCVLLLLLSHPFLQADEAIFFGNSFTQAGNLAALVQDLTVAKGKALTTQASTRGGQGWNFHLSGTATGEKIKARPWNWVVIQDYSTNATHINKGDRGDFMKNGEVFYDRIFENAPQAAMVLFETWAYAPKSAIYKNNAVTEESNPDTETSAGPKSKGPVGEFANPEEMLAEIHKSYSDLQALMQAKDPKRQVLLAPVGTAFAQSLKEHPEIDLYSKDGKHPNLAGSYLAACVFYATFYRDSPVGAQPPATLKPETAQALQETAARVVLAKPL